MCGAIPIFSQIGQTIWNVRVEIHLRLSVKHVTNSVFTKLRPPPHFFVENYHTEFHENPLHQDADGGKDLVSTEHFHFCLILKF